MSSEREQELEYRILQVAREQAKRSPWHEVSPYELETVGASPAEIEQAVNLLHLRGWIRPGVTQNALGTFQISPAGLEVLEQWEGKRGLIRSASMYHFHSSVGVVQTGPGATASVVQVLAAEDREVLLQALRFVGERLVTVEKLPGSSKDEVLELVKEVGVEVQKPKPNGIRLRSILSAIATAIQTTASLQPAYQALKAALLPLGILLP